MVAAVALLSEPLALHDIEDTEALARSALHDHLRQGAGRGPSKPSWLSPEDFEDALSWSIAVSWDAARFYPPGWEGQLLEPRIITAKPFSHVAYWLMRRRIVDWYRKRFGSSRYNPRPRFEPINGQLAGLASFDPRPEEQQLEGLSPAAELAAEQIVLPMAALGLGPAAFARKAGLSSLEVRQAIALVKRELQALGLEPAAAEEEPSLAPSSAPAAAA